MRLIEKPLRLLLWAVALQIFTCPEVELRAIAKRQTDVVDGLDYLSEFGYLAKANLETGALRSKQELETAIRKFQQMAQLRVTGELDSDTIQQMKKPRCGIPDVNSSSGPQDFALGPSKWEKNDLSFRIDGYSNDLYWGDSREALTNAFRVWSDVSPLTFRETTGEADIAISFNSGYHSDGYAFDGPGNVLAHAFPPGSGRGGDAHFDEDEKWTVRSQDGTNLYTVAAHEFGHSLGIYHSNVPGALMYPWYQGYKPKLELHTDDIRAIQTLYGGKPPSGRTDRPPTTVGRPTVPTRIPPTPPKVHPYTTTPRPRTAPRPYAPNPCTTDVDAVANIRGEIFGFKGKWFWRLTKNGLEREVPYTISEFWFGVPEILESVDAVYERNTDYAIVFFKGNRYWEFKGNNLDPKCPKQGKSLSSLGLPESVTEIQGAFTWGLNKRTYLFSGYNYWRMDKSGLRVEKGYPKATDAWTGVPVPFDTVFTHFDGNTYFFKGTEFWAFGDRTMRTEPGYPKKVVEMWVQCPAHMRAFATKLTSSSTWTMFFLTLPVILLSGTLF